MINYLVSKIMKHKLQNVAQIQGILMTLMNHDGLHLNVKKCVNGTWRRGRCVAAENVALGRVATHPKLGDDNLGTGVPVAANRPVSVDLGRPVLVYAVVVHSHEMTSTSQIFALLFLVVPLCVFMKRIGLVNFFDFIRH